MIRQDGDNVLIDVLVQPRASRARVGPMIGDRLKVAVTAPPVDGKANAAVIKLMAKSLDVRRAQIDIASGTSSRRKTIRVSGLGRDQVLARFPEGS